MRAPSETTGEWGEFYDTTVKPGDKTFANSEDVKKGKIFYANGGSYKTGSLEWTNYSDDPQDYQIEVSGIPPIRTTLYTKNKFLTDDLTISTYDASSDYYCVQFLNDSNIYAWQCVLPNGYASEPQAPTKANKIFIGWVDGDDDLVQFPLRVTSNIELHASWMKTPDAQNSDYYIGFSGLADTNANNPTSIERTGAARYIKPFTTTTSGRLVTMHNDMDSLFPFNEMSKVEDGQGSFISIPKMYIKWETVSRNGQEVIDGIKIFKQSDNSGTSPTFETPFLPDCFLKASGIGENTRVLIGVYGASYDNEGTTAELMSSRTGRERKVSTTRGSFRDICRRTNPHTASGSYTYQNWDLSIRTLFNFLCILYTGMPNYRAVIFPGRTGGGAEGVTAPATTGTCDGLENPNNGNLPASGWNLYTNSVKILGVEDPYGNCWEWIDGVNFNISPDIKYGGVQTTPNEFSDVSNSLFSNENGITRPGDNNFVRYLRTEGVIALTDNDSVYYVDSNGDPTVQRAEWYNPEDGRAVKLGDYNGDGKVTSNDAVYLLRHVLFPEQYPIIDYDRFSESYGLSVSGTRCLQLADFNHDGAVTTDDAVYLLRYTLFPERFPLQAYTSDSCPGHSPYQPYIYGYCTSASVSMDYRSYVFPCDTTENNKKPSVGSYNETSDQTGAGSTLAMGGAWTNFTNAAQIDAGLWTSMTSKIPSFAANYIGARLCARPK